jgi:hypothetical protein
MKVQDEWPNLQGVGVHFEDCMMCDSVDQLLDQHLARTEDEREEEVAEDKATLLDILKGL